jgi:hypothetical protein
MARQLSPALLGKQIDGIWHTGVLVYGQEYFYGGGIQKMAPELVVERYGMPPVQIVPLGSTAVPIERFEAFLREISPRFTAATYDLLRNNCNNFSNEFAAFLLGTSIPPHILALPDEVLATPFGAMLRPMLENMQREMSATGAQPFAIPFNDPSLASLEPASATDPSATRSLRFKVAGDPTLHLERITARIVALDAADTQLLSPADATALTALTSRLARLTDSAQQRQLWRILSRLLTRDHDTPLFFPALGLFRVLLLLPTTPTTAVAETLELQSACFDRILDAAERHERQRLTDAQLTLLLAVLVNGFATPGASELVLARAVRFLPFAFGAISSATRQQTRVLAASLVANCCLALQIEEEVVITTVLCGAVETLDRLSREQHESPTQQQTIEGVVGGVASLVRNFEAARSLCVELGLPDVARRLHASSSLGSIQPLLSEFVALI